MVPSSLGALLLSSHFPVSSSRCVNAGVRTTGTAMLAELFFPRDHLNNNNTIPAASFFPFLFIPWEFPVKERKENTRVGFWRG